MSRPADDGWGRDPVALLQTLVRTSSVNPMGRPALVATSRFERDLTDVLLKLCRAAGLDCREQPVSPGRSNLIVGYHAPRPRRTILWDVHQDTVPADGMTIPPFDAYVQNGRLYGRGACDVKGSMAAMLWALRRLARERPPESASVFLVFTVDEEYTHTGSSFLAENLPASPIDLAIVAEPTGLNLVTTHKGAVRWRVHARGAACHSSRPELGDNAIYHMARVVTAFEAIASGLRDRAGHPVLGPPTLSVGTIAGGTAANIVPDACTIEIDRRLIPGEHPDAVQHDLMEELAARLDPRARAGITHEKPWVRMPALRESVPPADLSAMSAAIQRVTGIEPGTTGVPFGTDAGPLSQAGVPCVVFGPGSIDQAHTKDEWIDVEQVLMAAECYFELAHALG